MKLSNEVRSIVYGSKTGPDTSTKEERTKLFLAQWRDENGEWEALFAVMMLASAWDYAATKRYDQLIDTGEIAGRIDELRKQMAAKGA